MKPQIGTGSDAQAREIIRTSLDESLIVEASAGTGKTTELVNRIVAVLRAGRTTIDRIVAVTFTHKAAGELKVRLRQELDRARAEARDLERTYLEAAIGSLEEAVIGTIHSFCAQVLRERPVEARVDPAFAELAEREQQRIYDRAFRHWFERALDEERPGLRRALSRLAWSASDSTSPSEQLRIDGWKLVEWRDFQAPWRREEFDRVGEMRELAKAVRTLAVHSRLARNPNDPLVAALRPACAVDEWLQRSRLRRTPDYDAIEALLIKLLRDLKRTTKTGRGLFSDQMTREAVLRELETLIAALERFKQRSDADFAAELQVSMLDLVDCYEQLKRQSGKLDFVDLLVKVRDLVRENAEVRRHLQRRFTHFFIDEFQDTDPVQAEILLLLASQNPDEKDWRNAVPEPGKLFIVGDPKQSIYKFRRADVLLYQDVRDQLVKRGVRLVHMSYSHRAVQPIQECVNAAFAGEIAESAERGQTGYVPMEGNQEPIGDQPSVIALPAPRPWSTRGITKAAIDRCLPDAVSAFVDWLIHESGWKVRVPGEPGALTKIEARHIAILFRRFVNYGEDITRGYIRALEARGIRHLLVGSKSFHQREEIETLRAACAAIEWPADGLSVYATLKGSLFAVPDNTLLRYRMEVGRLNPLRPGADGSGDASRKSARAAVDPVLDILAELHRNRNERPVAETLNRLLEASRAHAGFALRPGGHHVISNVYRFLELARGYESSGGISFRGFVEDLAERADRADAGEAPMVEESADGVRLMTVHTAKGLEFPIVILADMTANIAQKDPDRYLDPERRLCALRLMRCAPWELSEHDAMEHEREIAEGVRVAYVAATRARDLLVVTAVGDQPIEGTWISPLNKAIYPPLAMYRRGAPARGCPSPGDRTVLPARDLREGADSIRPGEHSPESGAHTVVWWDPAALRLDSDGRQGLADFEVLTGNSPESGAAYSEWREKRAETLERGATPAFEIANPTDMPDAPKGIAVEFLKTPTAADRPYGPLFGTMVHALLRDTVRDPAALDRVAEAAARTSRPDQPELDAAVAAVRAALAHPLLERARRASRCLCEVPVSLRLDEGQIMEGNIDLAFEEAGAWHIVDYKTDAASGARRSQYERQVGWYGAALARITGQPVRCYLLSV
jgi:ATP-dependent helicase/nuclease subunit A